VLESSAEQVPSAPPFGGPEGNEVLTSATAVILTLLLAAEGITILDMGGMRSPHMFIGLVLIPPVLVKLGSTGYRFARYYTRMAAYRDKGPPMLPLRLLAPLLVLGTVTVFGTGVALLLVGRRDGTLLEVHKVSFIVWGVVFAVHFLAYVPRTVRSLRVDWTGRRRREVAGAGARLAILGTSILAGVGLALALLSLITRWHGERPF
jgi:hypothetical protein